MIRLAIVEDDDLYIRQLEDFVYRYGNEAHQLFEISIFHDGDEILDGYKACYDIILMDIQMRFVDGMTAAEEIRRVDQEVVIMFITNMTQYAVRGYQVDALDYIIKPVEYYAFSRKMDRAIGRMRSHSRHFVSLRVDGGIQKVDTAKILYVESFRHDAHFFTEDGELVTRLPMQEAESALAPYGFFRAGKGYLVNLGKVDAYRDGMCLLGGTWVPVSRAKKKEFLEAMTKYFSKKLT